LRLLASWDFLRAAEARGIQNVSLPSRKLGLRSALPALIRSLKKLKIDLLCAHGFKSDVLGLLAGRFTRIPVVCFLRGWTAETLRVRIYEAVDQFLLRFADRIVCLSGSQARNLAKRNVVLDKIRIVRNAIDIPAIDEASMIRSRSEMRRRFALPLDCFVVATAGRLSPEKGVSDFLEASSTIDQQFPNVRFVIFGHGVLRQQLEHKCRELGMYNRITFAGFQQDLRSLLPGIDLLVNPSHSEEMPNIVLEGMAAGVPVVATAVGGVEEIGGPERALRLVPPGNPKMLANAIGELISEPSRAKALAQLGRTRVGVTYSLTRQRSELHNLYQDLLPSRQAELAC